MAPLVRSGLALGLAGGILGLVRSGAINRLDGQLSEQVRSRTPSPLLQAARPLRLLGYPPWNRIAPALESLARDPALVAGVRDGALPLD